MWDFKKLQLSDSRLSSLLNVLCQVYTTVAIIASRKRESLDYREACEENLWICVMCYLFTFLPIKMQMYVSTS